MTVAVLNRLARLAGSTLRAPRVMVWLAESDFLLSEGQATTDRSLCRQIFTAEGPVMEPGTRDCPNKAGIPADAVPCGVACLGVPLVDGKEHRVGAICLIDEAPRSWSDREAEILAELGASAMTELDLRRELECRERAEATLQVSEQRFRLQAEFSTDMIARYNTGGIFLDVTVACRDLLGYEPEELLGRPIYEFIHPDDLPTVAIAAEALLTSPGIQLHTCRLRHKDGRYVYAEGSNRAVLDPVSGAILEVHCASRNVTERVRAQEALRLSEERFHLATLATNDAIWDWDLRTDIIWWNESVTRLFGHSLEEVGSTAAGWYDLLHPDDRERVATSIHAAIDSAAESWMVEYRFRRKDGSYAPIVDRGLMRRDENGRPSRMLGSMMDLTRIERAESELRENRERLVAALHASGTGTFRWDLLTNAVECDEQLERLLDLPPGESIELPEHWIARIHPEDREDVITLRGQCVAEGMDFGMEYRVVWSDGSIHWLDARGKIVTDPLGLPVYMTGACVDITERKRAEALLAHQASHDDLTGLPNRTVLSGQVERCIATQGEASEPFSLLLLDLDRFKEINDTFGHHYGDAVLRELSPRLLEAVRGSDLVARLGGDEFGIILPGADEIQARAVTDRIRNGLERPIFIDGHPFEVAVSIGIALYPQHGLDAPTLLKHADVAMYAAKRAKSGCAVYAVGRDDHSPRRLRLVGELRHAIDNGQLRLHYQPTFNLKTMRPVGVEALARWQHPRDGLLGPNDFIPMAEQTGLIRPLGVWALREALHQRDAWILEGLDLGVSVNLSPENLQDDQLTGTIDRILDEAEVSPRRLTVEVTESAMMADPARAKAVLTRLHRAGVLISIDDFGTGYSSLAYLKELPVDEVKVDRSFVRDMAINERDACIVRSVIELGHNLGLRVVAEGVEDQATLDLLVSLGCDLAQGFFLGHPLPATELPTLLASSVSSLAWASERTRPSRSFIGSSSAIRHR